jgi:hypothetical protein
MAAKPAGESLNSHAKRQLSFRIRPHYRDGRWCRSLKREPNVPAADRIKLDR